MNDTALCTRYIVPLTVCGERHLAQIEVCLVHRPSAVLLVLVKDKTLLNKISCEVQLIADAIAAFQYNNTKRAAMGQPMLETMTIPCITMVGTNPIFYLVPVSKELSDAVMTGIQYPPTQTRVLKCATVAGHQRRFGDGMANIEFLALERFVAFKSLAKSHWEQFLA